MKLGLPFKVGDKVVELGGNPERPIFRPNVNAIPGPCVDYCMDLNSPMEELGYGIWDGVYASYVMEHIKHANLRVFIAEVLKLLRPDGIAIFFVPNLYEQSKRIVRRVDSGEFDDSDIHMIFGGDPDYEGNYHHTGWSPVFISKLFIDAGYSEVSIIEHPVTVTDMIIEAVK